MSEDKNVEEKTETTPEDKTEENKETKTPEKTEEVKEPPKEAEIDYKAELEKAKSIISHKEDVIKTEKAKNKEVEVEEEVEAQCA